ncbi:MAG: prepilin-type N-terminal cleavage/methylation domain-containing protein [Victivallales bacterium]|nr:prepilin-type N-terminal cleavage/methylation domain-containing protein [Victivallales bacterium]
MKKYKRTFTLIEILITIALIALLAAILLPFVQKARTRANMTNDVNNLKQIYTAILSYSQDYDEYMPYIDSIAGTSNRSKTLWLLLPYVNYNTKVLSPTKKEMDGEAIYDTVISNPASTPVPGFAYSPLYTSEADTSDSQALSFKLKNMSKVAILATYSNRYPAQVIHLYFSGSVH